MYCNSNHLADTVAPVRGRRTSVNIIHRFHFSSQLKRMSAVAFLATPSFTTHIASVKGAPEVIKSMVSGHNCMLCKHYVFIMYMYVFYVQCTCTCFLSYRIL